MADILIVDGNSIGHANHNATKLSVAGMETQAIFGFIKSLQKMRETYRGYEIVVLWDGKAQWRKELCPEYKENRKATDEKQAASKESYKKQSPFIRKAIQLLGVRQMLVTSAEADDMAGLMVKKLSGANRIVLVTGDKDWLQLVRPGVTWFDPIRDRTVNMSNFFEFTGYKTPEQFVDGKALMGDSSDNISGVGGIGEKGAPEFVAEFGSVQKFFEQVAMGYFVPKKKAHQRLYSPEGQAIFNRNRKIMNLLDVPIPPKEDVSVIAPAFNSDAFKQLCEKLAFASILREFDLFINLFKE